MDLIEKIQNHIENLHKYIIQLNEYKNKCSDDESITKIKIYEQHAIDLIDKCNMYLSNRTFTTLYDIYELFCCFDNGILNVSFDQSYFEELTHLCKNLNDNEYVKFVNLVTIGACKILNTYDNFEFIKTIKNNLDKCEINNICTACSEQIKNLNNILSNSFSVRIHEEEQELDVDEKILLKFKNNVIELLTDLKNDGIYFGKKYLKNIFENADLKKLKSLYSYFEKYRADCLDYYTNEHPMKDTKAIKGLQEYYSHKIEDFPEIVIPGSNPDTVLSQEFNKVLGRMYTQRELCSDKYSSEEVKSYKNTISFLKNFIMYLNTNIYCNYSNGVLNGGELIRTKEIKDIRRDITALKTSLNQIQKEFVIKDWVAKNLMAEFKHLKSSFKKNNIEYFIYKGDQYQSIFVKEIREIHNSKFNQSQKEIILYYLPYGSVDNALQIARLDISKDNLMVHKPKGSQNGKIVSKYHLHIYTENDQIFVNVDEKGVSKKAAGYEISGVFSDELDEKSVIDYFNKKFELFDDNSWAIDQL